jgi:hypothetical protein
VEILYPFLSRFSEYFQSAAGANALFVAGVRYYHKYCAALGKRCQPMVVPICAYTVPMLRLWWPMAYIWTIFGIVVLVARCGCIIYWTSQVMHRQSRQSTFCGLE